VAALIARINGAKGRAIGYLNPSLYSSAKAMRDIVDGNNGSFASAVAGCLYGLGSPDGAKIAALFDQRFRSPQRLPGMGVSMIPTCRRPVAQTTRFARAAAKLQALWDRADLFKLGGRTADMKSQRWNSICVLKRFRMRLSIALISS